MEPARRDIDGVRPSRLLNAGGTPALRGEAGGTHAPRLPPAPLRRPIADWIDGLYEAYPDRFRRAVIILPSLPFILAVALPLVRRYSLEWFAGAALLVVANGVMQRLDARAARRAYERSRTHTCRECGYDLRATPYVCPECGAFAKPPAGWRPPEFVTPSAGAAGDSRSA